MFCITMDAIQSCCFYYHDILLMNGYVFFICAKYVFDLIKKEMVICTLLAVTLTLCLNNLVLKASLFCNKSW